MHKSRPIFLKSCISYTAYQEVCIHSGYIYIVLLQVHYYSEALLTQHGYCVGVYTPKRHRQLRVKELPKVPTWLLEREPMAIRTKGDENTIEPPCPTIG